LRSPWAVGGAIAAVVLAAPYVVWQTRHGWPQLTVAGHIAGSQEGGRAGFFPFQLVMVSPFLVPVWLAGLLAPFRRASWRQLRFVPITYAVMADRRVDTRRSTPHSAPGRGDRAQRRGQRPHRPTAATRT
jgi:hypothetical protein